MAQRAIPRSYTGVESDPVLTLCAAHVLQSRFAPDAYRIWYTNFLQLRCEDLATARVPHPTYVISNPPFVRFHNLNGRARLRKELQSKLGPSLSSFSGASNYFLAKAATLIANPARGSSHKLCFCFQRRRPELHIVACCGSSFSRRMDGDQLDLIFLIFRPVQIRTAPTPLHFLFFSNSGRGFPHHAQKLRCKRRGSANCFR